ncbi:WW domain-binding protein 11-like [Manis pentadactyla]|uniref:WW domain-binding protein 11-like n=1 Tax=Manis pentadactyla TaxID=143292 RepID=UPI00255CFB02|nr:WW domain-binding protein 11-like [Manis pentadactyla]
MPDPTEGGHRPLSASSATPRRLPSELSPRNCYLPSALPDLERGPGGGAAQYSSARGPAPRTHLPSAPPSAPPDTAPSWGMKAPPSRPGRPRQGREENLLRRPPPPPPPRPALRLRRLTGQVSRGAACSKRVTAGSASPRGTAALGRVAVPVAERLGAACGTAAPTADGHVFVPFFFSFLPLLPPLSTEQHFPSLLPLPFLLRGWVEKGGGEGWGRAGAGQCSSSAPRRGRGRTATACPPPSRPLRDPREARGLSLRALPLRPRVESQAKTELRRKGLGRCFAPLPAVLRLAVWCGFIALASGRWRLLLLSVSKPRRVARSRSESVKRITRGMLFSGREVSFQGGSWNFHA